MSAPIIITVPNNYLAVDDVDSKVVLEAASPAPSRKRRLDHLSWEEKMQRKKLKNRVAAQTSRDRKKAKMDEMESRIQEFMDRNDRLVKEVESLKALNERLLSENTELRKSAARSVAGARGPAAGGAPPGTPSSTAAPGDVSPLADLLAHLESEEYLDTLHQLADSLLQEIDAGCAGKAQDVPVRDTRECPEGDKVVGTAAEYLESSESGVVDLKHDVHRILTQHSYAHRYTPDIVVSEPEEQNDKGDMFYASFEENCVTIEVPCEEQVEVIEETQTQVEPTPIKVETDFTSLTDSSVSLDDMKMLSPMSLSPRSVDESLLSVSPSHTSFSDLGYESLASPLSEPESMDLSDFWCESFSELFPGLA